MDRHWTIWLKKEQRYKENKEDEKILTNRRKKLKYLSGKKEKRNDRIKNKRDKKKK